MEPNESGLSSYYHHHPPQQNQQPQPPPPQQSPTSASPAAVIASPTNGTLPPHTAYPSSTVTPTSEGGKRKRGRPRKYATPEEAAAARKALLASSIPKKKKKDKFVGGGGGGGGGDPSSFSVSYSKKTPVAPPGVGNVGQGFTPHTLNVAAGEDVYQKIMLFMQQSKSEICILSASGSISNPSLRQPATFGGNITYEGRFDILSLSGSYIHTELGGRSGGLSVCLSSTDGQIIGGGIGGPLKAAGPVQVIVGTFVIDATGGMKANSLTGN
ncbi:AT-hook motif nuclear-localized protein 14 isoform X2 [Rhododendron vialii]|uniref:AT-hook motif nuclear-localized protein 14 isoform X2 n=1 Tax=Rhododendron vialii TaxID=182163 RepID=UPI00265E09C8|nr:AT-hook motif nuclear-localized protein 14 isoform X2 [Rhododendron vialii]